MKTTTKVGSTTISRLSRPQAGVCGCLLAIICAGSAMGKDRCQLKVKPVALNDKGSQLREISGIDESRVFEGLYWVHNDSGGSPTVFGISSDGEIITRINVHAGARDWEDITTGRCQDDSCIYVADFGDNAEKRGHYQLIVFQEPQILNSEYQSDAKIYNFSYPGGKSYNAEGLAFDNSTETLYSVRKTTSNQNTLYRFPHEFYEGMVLQEVCQFNAVANQTVTGADISEDGRKMLIRTYNELLEFSGDQIDSGFCDKLSNRQTFHEKQGEAVAYQNNDKGIISVSEGKNPPIYQFDCD